ncbi:unnamed protein product (macronuclear) [Paramecium tetraurelia]|uniref:Uncharacterized protein n=1 Tax=Paramecium tetraurelia TaxID=5888 RepID=A0C2Z7_PARTE|nr:uncharacterized protein GSPATT00034642001 [Paramecium tetraurelia]CAK65164.1 unnamed protein product [Paramecium tetraurelia]|eukprot:XP_001432561.1 hypothetical protein (macronuclear) [Paramecium tetraurelia strain d4-2]
MGSNQRINWIRIRMNESKSRINGIRIRSNWCNSRVNGLKLGWMGQGLGQGYKPQGPSQSKGQWTQDKQEQEKCVEITCADNQIVFKDRCVAQTCENFDKVQAKQEGGQKKPPLKFD